MDLKKREEVKKKFLMGDLQKIADLAETTGANVRAYYIGRRIPEDIELKIVEATEALLLSRVKNKIKIEKIVKRIS